jgi:DNA-binding NtrC family response regulator
MRSIYDVARRIGTAIGGKSRPIQILIVDDEVRFLRTISQRFSLRQFDVVTATNGYDALEVARDRNLDLALVDLKMPGMDGEELLRKLKAEHPLMEVVILTGHGSTASEKTCEEAGSYSYLHKPCETEELIAVLREAFEKRVMRRLEIERDRLETLIQQSTCKSSLEVIQRLKEIEEEVLKKEEPKI